MPIGGLGGLTPHGASFFLERFRLGTLEVAPPGIWKDIEEFGNVLGAFDENSWTDNRDRYGNAVVSSNAN